MKRSELRQMVSEELQSFLSEADRSDFASFERALVNFLKRMPSVTNVSSKPGRGEGVISVQTKQGHEFILSLTWNPARGTTGVFGV